MVEAWKKYIDKHPYKKELEEIIRDIRDNTLSDYQLIPLGGSENHFRIRKGKIRIVFVKKVTGNEIKAVGSRGDVYKSF